MSTSKANTSLSDAMYAELATVTASSERTAIITRYLDKAEALTRSVGRSDAAYQKKMASEVQDARDFLAVCRSHDETASSSSASQK